MKILLLLLWLPFAAMGNAPVIQGTIENKSGRDVTFVINEIKQDDKDKAKQVIANRKAIFLANGARVIINAVINANGSIEIEHK